MLHPKWAFYPQLCIYWFLVLRGYKVQKCTFLCVRESILKCRLPSGSSDRLKPTTEFFCLGRGVKCGLARPPRGLLEKHADALSPDHAQCQEKKSTAGGNGGLRGQPATHSTESDCSRHAGPWITSRSPMCRPARVTAGLESVARAPPLLRNKTFSPFAVVLVHPVAPLLRTSAPLCHFSSGLLIEMLTKDKAL